MSSKGVKYILLYNNHKLKSVSIVFQIMCV